MKLLKLSAQIRNPLHNEAVLMFYNIFPRKRHCIFIMQALPPALMLKPSISMEATAFSTASLMVNKSIPLQIYLSRIYPKNHFRQEFVFFVFYASQILTLLPLYAFYISQLSIDFYRKIAYNISTIKVIFIEDLMRG